MNALTIVTSNTLADLPVVTRQEAIEPFLNRLDSFQTRRAYRAAISEAMRGLDVAMIAEITTPMLTTYRAGLVARLDAREGHLSPASVALKLAAMRGFSNSAG